MKDMKQDSQDGIFFCFKLSWYQWMLVLISSKAMNITSK
jgi:hypothetical protein